MTIRTVCFAGALAALLGATAAGAVESAAPGGAWAERVQLVYDRQARTVARTSLRAWDAEPEKKLDFVWQPQAGTGIAADGSIAGKGKLIWRVRGSASYDPKTVYSTYVGALRDGRPNGAGRWTWRSGEVLEGAFVSGLLEGQGSRLDTAGNRYEGAFRAGLPHGKGRLALANGDIFTGEFLDGVKHGAGETRLAGGAVYTSRWVFGVENGRPALLADATLGGLLKAQSGGDAGRLDITVNVDQRLSVQSDEEGGVGYQQMVRDEDIAIYPIDETINNLWNGTGEVSSATRYTITHRDWEFAPAFVEVGLATTDDKRVGLDKLELNVLDSIAYRKPMLSIEEHAGCVGFRPTFSLKNDGWGEVKDMQMTVAFTGQEPGGPQSRSFTRPVGSFDKGIDVAIEDVIAEAGVNVEALKSERFSCDSMDAMNVCRAQVFNKVGFGEVADYVWGEDKLYTTVTGKLDYTWSDEQGGPYAASEAFRAAISLTLVETPLEAECGDGFGGSPEAGRYQDVRFKVGEKNYAVGLPLRGNKNLKSYVARLKLLSEPAMSSITQFNVAATMADGSVKTSKPVTFFFMRPRISDFVSDAPLPACYVREGTYGC